MLGVNARDLPVPGLTQAKPISPSALTTLLQCPHLFLLGTVFYLQEAAGPPPLREIGQPHYGGLLHRVAERFAREHGEPFGARLRKEGEELGGAPLPAQRSHRRGGAVTQERDADAVHARQAQVGEGGRRPACGGQLVRLAVVHRA